MRVQQRYAKWDGLDRSRLPRARGRQPGVHVSAPPRACWRRKSLRLCYRHTRAYRQRHNQGQAAMAGHRRHHEPSALGEPRMEARRTVPTRNLLPSSGFPAPCSSLCKIAVSERLVCEQLCFATQLFSLAQYTKMSCAKTYNCAPKDSLSSILEKNNRPAPARQIQQIIRGSIEPYPYD